MDQGSNNTAVTTVIALGALIGMFIVFGGTRLMDRGDMQVSPPGERASAPARNGEKHCLAEDCRMYREVTTRCAGGLVDPLGRLAPPSDSDSVCEDVVRICVGTDCRPEADIRAQADFSRAMAAIGQRAGQQWRVSEAMFHQYRATMRLHLDDDGYLADVETVSTSGNPAFDQSIRLAIQQAEPFAEIREVSAHTRGLLQQVQLSFGRGQSPQ